VPLSAKLNINTKGNIGKPNEDTAEHIPQQQDMTAALQQDFHCNRLEYCPHLHLQNCSPTPSNTKHHQPYTHSVSPVATTTRNSNKINSIHSGSGKPACLP
jgi:hypothetical protein